MTNQNNGEIVKSVKTEIVEDVQPKKKRFTVSDVQKARETEIQLTNKDPFLDNSTMTSPLMRTCLMVQNYGAHFDPETDQWRIYDNSIGLWRKVSLKSFRIFFSNLLNKENNLPRGKSSIIPEKKLDDVWYQIFLGNPVGELWEPDYENYHYTLPFANGVLNLKTRVKEKFYKEQMLESKLERKYLPDAGTDCENWDNLLDNLSNEDARVKRVLEAFALLSMTGKGRLERSILSLYSEMGGSGKGTYMNTLLALAGPDRSITSEISRLTDDTTLGQFESKTLLVFPEEREILRSSSHAFARILKLASLDTITGRPVYSKEIFRFVPKAVMVFSSNIHVFPNDGAGSRRLLILKTYATPPEERDRNFGQKVLNELPQITNRLLDTFNWNPEEAAQVIEEAADYKVFLEYAKENADETSTVAQFLNTMVIPVCPINDDRELSMSEYKKNSKDYMSAPIPAMNALNLYRAYKNYITDTNPGARPLKDVRFYKEVIMYYKINLGHKVEFTYESIPNLMGAPKRLLGITPNPDTWVDEYKMFKQ